MYFLQVAGVYHDFVGFCQKTNQVGAYPLQADYGLIGRHCFSPHFIRLVGDEVEVRLVVNHAYIIVCIEGNQFNFVLIHTDDESLVHGDGEVVAAAEILLKGTLQHLYVVDCIERLLLVVGEYKFALPKHQFEVILLSYDFAEGLFS